MSSAGRRSRHLGLQTSAKSRLFIYRQFLQPFEWCNCLWTVNVWPDSRPSSLFGCCRFLSELCGSWWSNRSRKSSLLFLLQHNLFSWHGQKIAIMLCCTFKTLLIILEEHCGNDHDRCYIIILVYYICWVTSAHQLILAFCFCPFPSGTHLSLKLFYWLLNIVCNEIVFYDWCYCDTWWW